MGRKTDGEKIDELEKLAATLVERLDNVRKEKADEATLARMDERLKALESKDRRWLPFLPTMIGGIILVVLTFLLTIGGQALLFKLGIHPASQQETTAP